MLINSAPTHYFHDLTALEISNDSTIFKPYNKKRHFNDQSPPAEKPSDVDCIARAVLAIQNDYLKEFQNELFIKKRKALNEAVLPPVCTNVSEECFQWPQIEVEDQKNFHVERHFGTIENGRICDGVEYSWETVEILPHGRGLVLNQNADSFKGSSLDGCFKWPRNKKI